MSRINVPASITEAPEASRPILEGIAKAAGKLPNFYAIIGNSPAALKAITDLDKTLATGVIDRATRERIALAVGEINDCDYCLAAHTYIGRNLAKLDDAEITAAREGHSADPKADAAVRFAVNLVNARGGVPASDVDAVRAAGWSDAAIVEIVALVGLNTITNYINESLKTVVDFPVVTKLAA